ncbi:MFS transporter [Paenibacillus polygoni]|uniref:MFS transporter n=1 Tax=Paenibacillus polygoni TaxID=3050112 RepID=A0ABY8X591_9BACL|nr:MFS transporter [Paenibacillus polygoni]WIV18385.1 MFS transporter [Paenibacillus polygoni]
MSDSSMNLFLNRNFLFMFFGRLVTNVGDSIYAVAAMWLVSELGGSTFYTGLAGFLSLIPRFIQFFSGPIIDRISIRHLLIHTQLIQAFLLLIIPAASYLGQLNVVLVLIISPIISIFNTLIYPAQMSSLPSFVPKKDLTKANSYFTFAGQGIDTFCNAVSGVLIVIVGAVSIYLLDSVLFIISAILFSFLRIPKHKQQIEQSQPVEKENISVILQHYKTELLEGIHILLGKSFSRLLWGMLLINLVGGATFVVLPAFSKLHGGPELYGLLLMAQAMGSMFGALIAPFLKLERIGMGLIYATAFSVSGILWTLSVHSPNIWMMMIIYGLSWVPGGVTNILINSYIQKAIPQHLLGRVFSASYSLSGIAAPIGSLCGGILGEVFGSEVIIGVSGLSVLFIGLYWLFDKTTRKLPSSDHVTEKVFQA